MSRRARVKVKQTALTRTQAAAEFGRKKAKLKRQQSHRRVMMIFGGAVALVITAGTIWWVQTGAFEQTITETSNGLWQSTADAGFRLDQITLHGRTHTDSKLVMNAIATKQGVPILGISLEEMRARLETVPQIKSASIARTLPNKLDITITERVPAAFWQYEGNVQLVDRDGVVLPRGNYPEKMVLPVVVGADAPKHMAELITLIEAAPSLKPDVVAAVRIGSRRWNIQLSRNIVVMLPEEEPAKAWSRFADLVSAKALLSKSIRSVDMRMEDRIFIMPVEEKKSPIILTGSRDT